MRLSKLLSSAAIAACLVVVPTAQAAKRPAGALKVQTKTVAGVTCGKAGRTWVSGKKLAHGWFMPDSAQSAAYAKLAKHKKGAAKRHYLTLAKSYHAKAIKGAKTCNRGAGGGGSTGGSTGGNTGGTVNPGGTYTPPGNTPHTATPLHFALSGAAGIAMKSASSRQVSSGSTLDAVSPGGQVTDAVSSGSASIQSYLIAPNGLLYVIFSSAVDLNDTSDVNPADATCILAQVDPATGVPTCVDNSLRQIYSASPGGYPVNPSIQFDGSGAIYYTGTTSDGSMVLRKSAGGTTTDLYPPDKVQLSDFLVLSDGSVFVTGRTTATGVSWTRRITPAGGLQQVFADASTYWMHQFPDNNVYYGLSGNEGFGVGRYLTSGTPGKDPDMWITDTQGVGHGTTPHIDAGGAGICQNNGVDYPAHEPFCDAYDGAYSSKILRTASGKVFVVAAGQGKTMLAQIYPSVSFPSFTNTSLKSISVAQVVFDNLILSGVDASGNNETVVYNTDTNTDSMLIPGDADQQYEIYHLNYVASGNKVMFDGLRFSDNKYVIGQVPVDGSAPLSAVTTGKWADFQTFG